MADAQADDGMLGKKLLALPVDYQYAGHGCGAFGVGKEWLAAAVRKLGYVTRHDSRSM